MRILLVEDDPKQVDLLGKLLVKSIDGDKLAVYHAGTLEEGLEKSRELKLDVTYLDLNLPDAPVEKVINSIKDFYPPVIVMTALDDPDQSLKLQCFAHGAQNFFQKPTDLKLLVPHLISTGAAAHLRRDAPKLLDGRK